MLNFVLRSCRILIIEDQADNVVQLQRVLLRAGFAQYRAIAEASEAMAVAFDKYRSDLVVLDLHMPGMDGFEVLRQLNQLIPQQTYLPFAIPTAELSQAAREFSVRIHRSSLSKRHVGVDPGRGVQNHPAPFRKEERQSRTTVSNARSRATYGLPQALKQSEGPQ